ncbi:MAG: ATP-binding protein, partial [Bryobacteraceae bacterium]
ANLKVAIDESRAEVTSSPLPTVCLHKFQLEQLFQNIIGNAIRYRSDAAPRIHIKAEPDGGAWKFSIQDNGIGIAAEYTEKIFGMFKRLHTAADYPGTGMGLAICQRIVERVGGRIWVESQLGRGSTFFFTLPAAKRDSVDVQRAASSRGSGTEILERMRAGSTCQHVPVVVLTSSDNQKDKDAVARFNPSRYLRKPLTLEDFLRLGGVFKGLLNPTA